jgi:hypothetical protein
MLPEAELVEGELLPDVYEPPSPPTLFGTSDPKLALARMGEVASALVDVIKDRGLYARIGGHEHITAEGWTTLGGMLGIVPVVVWTKPNESGDGYLARVEARTLDGRVVGAAESECSRAERRWRDADAYAIRSMSQTRAIGRALRAPLGQIVVLAGYEPAAAEEMPVVDAEPEKPQLSDGLIPHEHRPTAEQKAEIKALLRTLEKLDPDTDWPARCVEIIGVPGRLMTRVYADRLIRRLKQNAGELMRDTDEPDAFATERGESA